MTPKDVLTFWFTDAAGKWFAEDVDFDAMIRERFLQTHQRVVAGDTATWRQTPEGRLAEVIVLDQFSRNMFRGSKEAFAYDEMALLRAREAIAAGDDRKLSASERHMLYMPFMHSESKKVHQEAVRLFWSLPFWKWPLLRYEYAHKKIIDRFGRYPHRNKILGRTSTPEEVAFLAK